MITVHWHKDNKMEKGDHTLLKQWRDTPNGYIWIDLQDEDKQFEMQLLSDIGCHPLAIQDVQRERHPPKVEHFKSNSLVIYRGIQSIEPGMVMELHQVSVFFSHNFVITTHANKSLEIDKTFASTHLENLICSPIKLMCHILNKVASLYIDSILEVEEALDELEEQMSIHGSDTLLMNILSYQTRLRKFRRIFAYHEKIFQSLLQETELLPSNETDIIHSIQDVYDKFERLHSLSNLYYELCGDISDGYLSMASHQLNKTMQVLTVITAIFVPLSFLAGIYGMNFDNMPELHFYYGYHFLLLGMFTLAISLYLFFRKNYWP